MNANSNPKDNLKSDRWSRLASIVDEYVDTLREELRLRWLGWAPSATTTEVRDVTGALLARQVSLASGLGFNPNAWNAHIAPLILRSMTDTYINLAWIWKLPAVRSQQFIRYGLGQEKLFLEHLRSEFADRGDDVANNEMLRTIQSWIDSQRYEFLVEVDVGNWAGLSVREMALETGCEDLYRFSYFPFSAATHGMWNHVSKYNLNTCSNPLHEPHGVPCDPDLPPDFDYFYRAARYAAKSLALFDEMTGVSTPPKSAIDFLESAIDKLGEELESDAEKNESAGNS